MDPSTTGETDQPDQAGRDDAFKLLADDTRLAILETLWVADGTADAVPMRFTDLRDRVGVADPGRLNYHLNELRGRFVRRTDDGYELMDAGKRLIRMLLAGTAIDGPEIEPVPVDISCWYCGGQPEWSYTQGYRYLECTDCDARCVESFEPGVISKTEFPPSGLRNRTPNEINESDRIWGAHRRASVMDGVCPECAGEMPVTSIEICDDHRPDWEAFQFCDGCGSIFRMLVSHVCTTCKYRWRMPTRFYPTREPAVTAFYYDHGIEFDLATHEQRTLLLDYRQEVHSEDPLRIRITIPVADEAIRLTYDERMDVVETTRDGRSA